MKQERSRPKRQVWEPAEYDVNVVRAIQALALYAQGAERQFPPGEEPPAPSATDVKRALDWIIHGAAHTYPGPYDNGFVPDDPHGRIAAFIDGRQSVGQQIVKLMKINPDLFDKDHR